MNISDITALIGLSISSLIFILLASRAKTSKFSLIGYTMADKSISSKQYGSSFVAASSSLATVMLFFLTNAKFYGLTLLWCGLTYLLGQYLFVRYVRDKDVIKEDVRTVSDLWFYTIRSKVNARIITALTITSFLIILFIELYVGSIIFGYFFSSFTPYYGVISFIVVGLIVIYYVRIGGLKAVMQTDGWQLMLMLVSVIAVLLFSILFQSENGPNFEFSKFFSFDAEWQNTLVFCFWILIINVSLPFTQLSSWQRVAACTSGEEVWKGFRSHILKFSIIWFVPVIAFAILSGKGMYFGDLGSFLDAIKSSGGISELVLYPLIVIGFGSALFSTADTALIALTTSLADTNTFKKSLEKLEVKKLKLYITIISFIIMLSLAAVFSVAQANVGEWFLPLIYNVFGQLGIIAPLIIYSLWHLKDDPISLKPTGNWIISISILIAWFIIVYATFKAVEESNQLWSQLSTPIGMTLTTFGLIIGLKFKNLKTQ
ncbi:hypothetical protein IMCC3317_18260 [Kordia antarctica]|uniref:Uncharacterized protein n=1 Tax=Kordia antarctica TaxID=1218801 RepID=A0A7L4ZIA2_9FLAO|nr:hypothetical protein [Kordia antarctica]QHI36463.1 hypothetical protein IMCC3317_18260 [Kordia antarctica]